VNRSKISEVKFRTFVKLFSVNWDTGQIAKLISLNQNMVNRYLMASSKRIASFCDTVSPISVETEVDESFLGGLPCNM